MSNITKFNCTLAVLFFSLFVSNCFAVEVTARYEDGAPGFEQSGVPEVSLSLKSRGMRKVGASAIITNWSRYCLETKGAPYDVYVVAVCTPSAASTWGEMTNLTPPYHDLTTGQLSCAKGQGMEVYVVDPETPTYEYVADLTATRETKSTVDMSEKLKVQTGIKIPAFINLIGGQTSSV